MLFQSIPSRRGPEGLPGRHDCEGGGQAARGNAAESLPETQRPRRHFSGDERAACQGDALHVSRVLAEAAAQLRSFEGSGKQAAQNQTVSGAAAIRAHIGEGQPSDRWNDGSSVPAVSAAGSAGRR